MKPPSARRQTFRAARAARHGLRIDAVSLGFHGELAFTRSAKDYYRRSLLAEHFDQLTFGFRQRTVTYDRADSSL